MQEIVYLLKVPEEESLQNEIGDLLRSGFVPNYVRLSTLAPLSNYGYPPGAEGAILAMDERGLVVGVVDDNHVPRSFVPWSNVAYLAESAELEHPVESPEEPPTE